MTEHESLKAAQRRLNWLIKHHAFVDYKLGANRWGKRGYQVGFKTKILDGYSMSRTGWHDTEIEAIDAAMKERP